MTQNWTVLTASGGEEDAEAVPLKQSDKVKVDTAQLTSGRVDIDRKQTVIPPLTTRPRWPLGRRDDVRDFRWRRAGFPAGC